VDGFVQRTVAKAPNASFALVLGEKKMSIKNVHS